MKQSEQPRAISFLKNDLRGRPSLYIENCFLSSSTHLEPNWLLLQSQAPPFPSSWCLNTLKGSRPQTYIPNSQQYPTGAWAHRRLGATATIPDSHPRKHRLRTPLQTVFCLPWAAYRWQCSGTPVVRQTHCSTTWPHSPERPWQAVCSPNPLQRPPRPVIVFCKA